MPKRAVLISMLPAGPFADRFAVAKTAGFEAIEMQTLTDAAEVEAARAASASTGIAIHSVMNMEHWRSPISSADPAVVGKSVAGMETSLRNAKAWGAGGSCSCRRWSIRRPRTRTPGRARSA